ncbi:M43 family zinc metalloprotease [Flavobacterium sp. DGU11]|uniref:M43 family zinc metalloprotease n=1 Tax=Flavobacterium arundinis TaxID=3139143 RepID=A0ABU9HZN0_9FLAO
MKLNFTIKAGLLGLVLFSVGANAQDHPSKRFGRPVEFAKCGVTEYEALLQKKSPQRANKQQFEQWLAPKVAEARARRLQKSGQNTNTVVNIPVVVHVIHNGDAVGSNENIAEGQILSQITVLNQDFRKLLNTPGHNDNPVGADLEIEFCMAQRDPAGLNTSGIIRYDLGSENGWDMEDVEVLKTQTQWDPTKYLNIWVVNEIYVGGFLQLAGYAQFPTDSGVDGLDGGTPVTANTDGVVIAANCFGSADVYPGGNYYPNKDKGRTASHEIGHFFGLRHIWGDETDCMGNDFCDDTPAAADANEGCPDADWDSCPNDAGHDMVQNYMDYTDDACLNIFTLNQKDRVVAVLANSPRRASLTTSDGCVPGETFNNDGSLNIQGVNPGCGSTFAPKVVLKNTGNTTLTAAVINYYIDAQSPATYNWTGSLASNQQATIQLPEFTVASGDHTFNVAINNVNGMADQAPANDHKSQAFTIVGAYNTAAVIVTIMTDDFGEETLWAIVDGNENPIAANIDFNTGEFNTYGSNELHTITVPIPADGCYSFGVFDLMADGMCCENGEGYYRLETTNGTVITEGGQFGQQVTVDFRIDSNLGIGDKAEGLNLISLYPNPANSQLTIALPQANALPDGYTIYNSLGQVMGNGKFASAAQQVNVSGFANGVYFIKIASGENSKTLQFIKY